MSVRRVREGVESGRARSQAWDVTVEVRPVPGVPPLTGPHELAWSHILDRVFADAYRARAASLCCVVPSADLSDAVQLRAELTPQPEGDGDTALALLAGGGIEPDGGAGGVGLCRLYTLEAGRLAPRPLRGAMPPVQPSGWTAEGCTSLFAWPSRLLGIPIRLGGALGRPDGVDQAMYRMRRGFVREGRVAAYYHLRTWRRDG